MSDSLGRRKPTLEVYYPFGMAIKPFDKEGYPDHRFTYNGKELEESTGYLEYGQRDYDPQLGRFHKVDRFAEKYYSMTPYQYGANNPIKYVDVHGDSIMVFDGLHYYKYSGGKLFDFDGNEYKGGNDFLDQFVAEMSVLQNLDGETGDEIRKIISDLENGDVRLSIYEGSSIIGNIKNLLGEDGDGDMNHVLTSQVAGVHVNSLLPDNGINLTYSQVEPKREKLDGTSIASHFTLIHELQHAHDIYTGKAIEIANNVSNNASKIKYSMEARAMVTTNKVRNAMGVNEICTQYTGKTLK